MIDSVFKTGKNYYPQVFVEEYKYVVKEKKMPKYIADDIEISSDSDREESDEENSNKGNFDEENSGEGNSMKKFLVKKILMKKVKYRMLLFLYLKHFKWFLNI